MMIISLDHPHIDHPRLSAFAELAEQYCELIENRGALDKLGFIHSVHLLLPSIYAAGLVLPWTNVLFDEDDQNTQVNEGDQQAPVNDAHDPDEDIIPGWNDLYASLNEYFGEKTHYREIFDPYEPAAESPEVRGSLADDLADTYRDLRTGLEKWRRGESGAALWHWRFHFEVHWGEHATGAIRALHCRAAWWDTWYPPAP